MVFGISGFGCVWPPWIAFTIGEQPRLGAVHLRVRIRDESDAGELLDALVDLRDHRARGHRHDRMVRRFPAKLFSNLVAQRLGAFGVVRAHVHVDEGPAMRVCELAAEPLNIVIVAVDGDHGRPVHSCPQDLAALQVTRDEHQGPHPGLCAMRGDRAGEVSGRRAGDGVHAELERLGGGDRDDPVLERIRRVDRVVLQPEILDPQELAQPVRGGAG